jgi:large repetitive protein
MKPFLQHRFAKQRTTHATPMRAAPMRAARAAIALACIVSLSSCGGGDSVNININANNDSMSLTAGSSGSLLANDTLGGVLVNLGLITFSIISGTLPGGVSVVNGTVNIGIDTTPGLVSFSYQICETASTSNCASAQVQINVSAATIVANPDSFSLGAGGSGNVLANDTLGGTPATAARVVTSVNAVGGALPNGIALSPAGVLTVGNAAPAGTFVLSYRICQITAPSNCANSTATVTVPSSGG